MSRAPRTDDDERWMGLALREARHGDPSPNPHVGAVVVKGNVLLGKGHHPKAGEKHAEIIALEKAGRAARGATLYVTFEPCNHFGRTPPCTEAIIAAGVRRVVVGARDMAPHVPGAARRLRRAGIRVDFGVREAEAARLVEDFGKYMIVGMPFVTLKAGMTLDGRIAARSGKSKWITSEAARKEAHRMRAAADAVLVGIGTVLADDPALNVRHVKGRHPARVVLDARLRTPPRARLLTTPGGRVIIFHGPATSAMRRRALEVAGAELVEVPAKGEWLQLKRVLRVLAERDVVRLLVEGGGRVHGAFLEESLADDVALFVAPCLLADPDALPLAAGRAKKHIDEAHALVDLTAERVGPDLLVRARVAKRRLDTPKRRR